jgi:hypothetical protein
VPSDQTGQIQSVANRARTAGGVVIAATVDLRKLLPIRPSAALAFLAALAPLICATRIDPMTALRVG